MSFIGNLLSMAITLLIYAFIGRAIISWLFLAGVRNDLVIQINRALGKLTEPIIAPLRRVIPPLGMFDITPIVAIVGLVVLRAIIRGL
ncbi:MAG: YggT family protein [Chloroflexi bacterium]|nr:YggT family protein [Chloroflexota bacterium]MCH7656281.1 YggT family protein [Chloroflexota bacterium]